MSIDRIEDLFDGFRGMMSYLVDDLVFKGHLQDAYGICKRHNLFKMIREDTMEKLNDVVYDQSKE